MGRPDFCDGARTPQQAFEKIKNHLNGQRMISLDIADNYDYVEPALIEWLKAKVTPH